MKLNEDTSIPIVWVFMLCGCFITAAGFVATTCWWIFTVDARLTRIEHKMDLESPIVAKKEKRTRSDELQKDQLFSRVNARLKKEHLEAKKLDFPCDLESADYDPNCIRKRAKRSKFESDK
jgi:hypothetical protein